MATVTMTMSSDKARNNWRDILDTAMKGGEVIISRYNKPAAVLLGIDELTRLRETLEQYERSAIVEKIRLSRQRVASGEERRYPHQELMEEIRRRRGNDVADKLFG